MYEVSEPDYDDTKTSLMQQALGTEDDHLATNVNLNKPPTSGAEYLLRVRHEASQVPDIVVAPLATLKSGQNIHYEHECTDDVPEFYQPSNDWQLQCQAHFSDLRLRIARKIYKYKADITKLDLPQLHDKTAWRRYCLGVDASDDIDAVEATPPFASTFLHMKQSQVIILLKWHFEWVESDGFSTNQGRWIYALLAILKKPILPEIYSVLRSFARTCRELRIQIPNKEHHHLKQLNIFICIIGLYFNQIDLSDMQI